MSGPERQFTIVLVDDSSAGRAEMAGIMREDQFLKVSVAGTLAEGTVLCLTTNPDLVLCALEDMGECIDLIDRIKENMDPPYPTFLVVYRKEAFPDFRKGHEHGADDYVERSLCGMVLLPKLHTLLKMRCLQQEVEREKRNLEEANVLLERNFKEMTAILLKILEVRMPGTSDRAETAKAAVEFLASRLEIDREQRKTMIFAALMHEMGKVGLPDTLVEKHFSAIPAESMPVFQQYATVGSMIISTITGFRESAEAVYHQLENYDGSGSPEGLMGEEIPLGSRALRAILFAEDLCAQGHPRDEVIAGIRQAMHTILDPRIANGIIEFLLEGGRKDSGRLKLSVDRLEAGMVVAEDVYAASGVKLLPKGVQLQDKIIALLTERNSTDPIVGGVYIVVKE